MSVDTLMKRTFLHANGLSLAYTDFGDLSGLGPGLLLLHGLMGRASTWLDTAGWLIPHFHVIGLDQRGHGWSDKPDNNYSRTAYVEDAAAALHSLGLAPVVVIGHSMGGLNAWVLAARYPDLVRAIVIEDMSAATGTGTAEARFQKWFASWPVPFPTLGAVRAFFAREWPSYADYFSEVMYEAEDGYRPLFSYAHMLQSVRDWDRHCYWDDLAAVHCPALVVKGGQSSHPRAELQEMARCMPRGRYAEVPEAEHVVHYDQPDAWRSIVEPFLLELKSHA